MQSRPTGLTNPWFHLAMSVLFVAGYQLLLKLGADETAAAASAKWAWTGLSGLASLYVWLGLPLVGLGLLTWLQVLRYIPLSLAFPLSQIPHILVPLSSWLLLGESISLLRWGGIALVSLGLLVVAKPVAQLEERL